MTLSVREGLVQELKGKTIRVNDLGKILPGWPQGVNPDVKQLRDQIEARLDTYEPFCELVLMTSLILHCSHF